MYSTLVTDYKWNWIDDGLLPYALAAMRALWIGLLVRLWSQGLTPGHPDLISPLLVFGLLAGSTACAQFGVYVVKTNWQAILLVVLGGLGAVTLTLYLGLGQSRPAFWELRWLSALLQNPGATIVTLMMAVWLWWWGIRTGRERLHDIFVTNFVLGLLALACAGTVTYVTHVMPVIPVLFVFILFFAISLAAMAIANLQSTRRFESSRTHQSLGLNRYWLGTVVVVIGALLLAGLLLCELFVPEAVTWILNGLSVLINLLVRVLLAVLLVVVFLLFQLFGWIASMVRLRRSPTSPPPTPAPGIAEQLKDLSHPTALSPGLYLALQILAGILLVAVIVLIFALTFRRFKTYTEEGVEETRESILSRDLLKEQLAQLFRRKDEKETVAPFATIIGDDPRAQIRRIYQSLLAWAASRDIPRPAGLTPDEYSTLLGKALLPYREPIAVITGLYQQARYSTAPIPATSAEEASRAWRLIAEAKDERV